MSNAATVTRTAEQHQHAKAVRAARIAARRNGRDARRTYAATRRTA